MLLLPLAWTYEARFPSEARILELWDSVVLVISGTGADTVFSFLPQCGPDGQISVSGCCTDTFCYIDRPKRPGYGSRSRPRLPGRYFRDLRACLRSGTAD